MTSSCLVHATSAGDVSKRSLLTLLGVLLNPKGLDIVSTVDFFSTLQHGTPIHQHNNCKLLNVHVMVELMPKINEYIFTVTSTKSSDH